MKTNKQRFFDVILTLYNNTLRRLLIIIAFSIPIFEFSFLDDANAAKVDDLQNEVNELKEQINDLEDLMEEIDARVGSRAVINAFDATNLDIGGFLHTSHTTVQTNNASEVSAGSFNRMVFEILVKAELAEDWSAFMAQAFMRNSGDVFSASRTAPSFSPPAPTQALVIAWVNYRSSDALHIQFGRFITPHGIINIEHFPATLLDPEQPRFLRPFSGDSIFPNFVTGLHVHGRQFLGDRNDNIFQYNFYTANHTPTPEKLITGGRLSLEIGPITVGLNAARGTHSSTADRYDMLGIDCLIKMGPFLWRNEFFKSSSDDPIITVDREAFYTQPSWQLTPEWIVFLRHDVFKGGANTAGTYEGDVTEDMVGVNYLPYPNVRLRTTLTSKSFDAGATLPESDATILQFSGTFSF